jgi:hypothetical protein
MIHEATQMKLKSPHIKEIETLNSTYCQQCVNMFPTTLSHFIHLEEALPEYEGMHQYYQMIYGNWEDIHQSKIQTPRLHTVAELKKELCDPLASRFIINRFFLTFAVIRIKRRAIDPSCMCMTHAEEEGFLVLDSHFKNVCWFTIDELVHYIFTESGDYNLILIGKLHDKN